MGNDKFTLIQFTVKNILAKIEAGEFVIPEIQRPFVWRRNQVRDLIDSLIMAIQRGISLLGKIQIYGQKMVEFLVANIY